MPYEVKHDKRYKKPWLIIRKDTGKIVGRSFTKDNAEASVRARYMGGKR